VVEEGVRRVSYNERKGDERNGEDQPARLNREFAEILYEVRTVILGVQVFFAFLVRVPFSQGFSSISTSQEYVFYATLVCTTLSAALLMAPAPHHRLLWRQHHKEERIELANRLIVAGLSFLALSMVGSVFLITELVFGGVVAVVSTVGVGLVFLWLWYGQPLLRMRP
jgi:magnesium-transporting ATPase (P-type)